MAELVDLYSKGVKRKLENYWAARLPGTRFAIGDIGTLNGYLFEKVGTLRELDLVYYEDVDDDPSPLDIRSESGVAISLKAVGENDPPAIERIQRLLGRCPSRYPRHAGFINLPFMLLPSMERIVAR
jgi:hypothetical protein